MAELFGTDRTSILRHIHNIYKTQELDEMATCAKIAQVRLEGNRQVMREVPFYNLDMIISVGYRVNFSLDIEWGNERDTGRNRFFQENRAVIGRWKSQGIK